MLKRVCTYLILLLCFIFGMYASIEAVREKNISLLLFASWLVWMTIAVYVLYEHALRKEQRYLDRITRALRHTD